MMKSVILIAWLASGWTLAVALDNAKPLGQRSHQPYLVCNDEVKKVQADKFRANRTRDSIQCSDHVWINAYRDASGPGHLTMLDIGCNKGYFSAELFNAFIPELGVNKLALWLAYGNIQRFTVKHDPINRCSRACDTTIQKCTEISYAPASSWLNRTLEVHCFEPSSYHVHGMMAAREQLSHKFTGRSAWHIHLTPVSRTPGVVKWRKDCPGETCYIMNEKNADNFVELQATSVDAFLNTQFPDGRRIAALKVDAEGFDPEVIEGAVESLTSKRVDILMFEYHRLNHWATVRLPDVVMKLDKLGMSCYFQAHDHLFKLSRGCWDEAYEIRFWSNVVCGLKGTWVENILDEVTWIRRKHPSLYEQHLLDTR